MQALCWRGKGDIRHATVPDPKIEHPRDAVIRVTACAICQGGRRREPERKTGSPGRIRWLPAQ
jgi:hypothetical protein